MYIPKAPIDCDQCKNSFYFFKFKKKKVVVVNKIETIKVRTKDRFQIKGKILKIISGMTLNKKATHRIETNE